MLQVTDESLENYSRVALQIVDNSSKDAISEVAELVLVKEPKALRTCMPGRMEVLRLMKAFAALGYNYVLYRIQENARNRGSVPATRTREDIDREVQEMKGYLSRVGVKSILTCIVEGLGEYEQDAKIVRLIGNLQSALKEYDDEASGMGVPEATP